MKIQTSIIRDSIDIYQGDKLLKSIPFTFNATTALQRVQHLRGEMLQKNKAGDLEGTGKAFSQLLHVIFGDDVAQELFDFYGDDYSTMLNDIAPILVDVIYPAVDRLTESIVATRKRMKA